MKFVRYVLTFEVKVDAEVWKIETKSSEGGKRKIVEIFNLLVLRRTHHQQVVTADGREERVKINCRRLSMQFFSLSLSTSSAYSASFFKHSPHVHTYVTSHEKNCFAGEMLKREPSVNNNGKQADAS